MQPSAGDKEVHLMVQILFPFILPQVMQPLFQGEMGSCVTYIAISGAPLGFTATTSAPQHYKCACKWPLFLISLKSSSIQAGQLLFLSYHSFLC